MSALDYKFLECVKHMPPLEHAKDKAGFDIRNSDVAKWIIQQPEVMQKIFDMAANHMMISYDQATRTWRGADNND